MPSPFTTSFASAASGNASNEGGANGRNNGSGDWSRPRTNGATATFRRPSTVNTSQRESGQSGPNPPPSAGSAYVPPHMNPNYQSSFSRNGAGGETRYSKDQLLDMFKASEKNGQQGPSINDLFMDGWAPGAVNGNENGGWGKKDGHNEASGADLCWDHEGSVQPVSLTEMDDEEREIFSTSVNSALKPATNKDGTPRDGLNRRTSMTQSQNMNDSASARPGGRRRDSSDIIRSGNPMSPTGNNRFSKDEAGIAPPPPSLLRRKTGNAETFGPSSDDASTDNPRPNIDTASPFGSLRRTNTNPVSAGLNGPSSPWSNAPQSAGFAPMGAFGNFGSVDTSSEKKPGFGSVRGQSRFKGLMSAGNSEDLTKPRAGLDSLTESASEQPGSRWGPGRSVQASKDLYEDDEDMPAGSAALGGDDASPPMPQSSKFRNPDQQISYDDIGFSSLGLGSDMAPFQQRRDLSNQQTPQRTSISGQPQDPTSPSNTNPFQSPEGDRAVPLDNDTDDDMHHVQYSGAGGLGQAGGRNLQNQFDSHDRSQTSSAKGIPTLGGLGNSSGLGGAGPWSAATGAVGTPSRAHAAQFSGFGDSFGPFGDLNSSGLGGAGFFGSTAPPSANVGAIGGRSKLGALFPSAMQDQMLGESRQDQNFGEADNFQANAPGFGTDFRDTDSPRLRSSKLEDMFSSENRGSQGFNSSFEQESSQAPPSASIQTPFSGAPSSANYFARSQEPDTPGASSQLPASQQRQMVMPDRMRWIYRDPQGTTQGPWSGLEMHDWYKAGFFSPELQVKKLEEPDYEPLAQLIRRIGNSREPFLVPQIGIPHGSSAPQPSATATAPAATPSAAQSSSAQPPFASSFPSFGTTLTAEQQNALERRKQEEQYLMARQKEHLAQQQVLLKQMQHMQGGMHGQQLHHQSSGQSLHSQPSFGSITSPSGYQPSPAQGPIQPPSSVPGFFDGQPRNAGPLGADPLGSVREEDLPGFMERLQLGRGQLPFGGHQLDHQQQVNAILQERARQQREQEQYELLQRGDDSRAAAERLEQYHQLRAQEEEQMYQQSGPIGGGRQPGQQQMQEQYQEKQQADERIHEQLSLSEQVQKAAAKQPQAAQPPQSPWAKVDTGMPQPFPPPQSSSPMPAPTPQRNRQSVADALNAESQSPSHTDSVDTPSAAIAPWAKENLEGSKGPSLKEIQAMEAKQAAQQEEMQAAARRALLEQDRVNQKSQPVAPAPGLPSSANWASSVSPTIPPTSGPSPWAKPATGKPTVATPVSGAKKTLAQIQKEEEARKNRLVAVTAAANATTSNANAASTIGGKRYADLASKNALAQNPTNAAWTTVGASGKAKTPAPAPGLTTRTASGNISQPPTTATKTKPAISGAAKTLQNANDEFQKWTKNALSKGLDPKINIDSFITTLLDLPAEPDIISDSIYANSATLDGRRFAEEFVRRRKLADRGVIPDAPASNFSSASNGGESRNGGGGWNEVAKKGGAGAGGAGVEKEAPGFKVVSGKKKGGKR